MRAQHWLASRGTKALASIALALQLSGMPAAAAETQSLSPGVTAREITVGSCAPLSGQMKLRGAQVVSGGRAYFSYINEKGGVNGRQINLLSCDDKYSASEAISCFDSCLKEKVLLGTLFQGTAAATKYVPMAQLNHLPVVGFSMGAQFLLDPVQSYVFQVRAGLDNETNEQIDTLWNKLHIRRIAIVYQNDAYGAAVRSGTVKALARYHAAPIAESSYTRLSENIDDVIKTLKAGSPQALILGASGDALSTIVKRKNDIAPKLLLVGVSVGTDLLVKEAGRAADGTIITQVIPLTQRQLPTVQLYERLLAKYENQPPSFSSFEGFLIAMVVVEGLKRAGKEPTRDSFVQALESIHGLDMGLGPKFKLSYSALNHDGFNQGVYWTIIKDGKVENLTDWGALQK